MTGPEANILKTARDHSFSNPCKMFGDQRDAGPAATPPTANASAIYRHKSRPMQRLAASINQMKKGNRE
jgi:hypothetical protein